MKVSIHTSLKKHLCSSKAISRHYGNKADDIQAAISAMCSLKSYSELWYMKWEFCELKRGMKGVYRLVLKGGLRMILRVVDSGTVKILDIVDYHYRSCKFLINYNNIY